MTRDRQQVHDAAERRQELVLPDDVSLPALAGVVPGAVEEVHDEAVTFRQLEHDTVDRRLARWGAELRVRLDGPDQGWRLVLPSDDERAADEAGDRDVVRRGLNVGDDGTRVPLELADLVRALVREAPLRAVAEVRTTRATVRLLDVDGRLLAAVHDDRVERAVSPGPVQRERRVRVAACGPASDAARTVTRLVDALQAAIGAAGGEVAAPPGAPSLRCDGPPDVVVPRRPGRRSTAGEVLLYTLATQVRSLLLADVAVRLDRPDAVHRLRVAARTLRSALRTFASLCDERWTTDLRVRLAVAADALGAVRDTEVLYARLEAAAGRLDADDRVLVLPALDALLRPRLLQARAAALEELRSDRYLELLVDLVDAARHPRLSDRAARHAADVVPRLVARDWERLARAVHLLRARHLGPRDPAWHRARILAKRARYGAEASAPSLRGRARRWARELSLLTDLLGELHDGVVAARVLQEAAEGSDGRTGFALGRLLVLEDAAVDTAAAQLLDRWPRVHRRLERRPLR